MSANEPPNYHRRVEALIWGAVFLLMVIVLLRHCVGRAHGETGPATVCQTEDACPSAWSCEQGRCRPPQVLPPAPVRR